MTTITLTTKIKENNQKIDQKQMDRLRKDSKIQRGSHPEAEIIRPIEAIKAIEKFEAEVIEAEITGTKDLTTVQQLGVQTMRTTRTILSTQMSISRRQVKSKVRK